VSSGGDVEYSIHDPADGSSRWVPAKAIASDAIPGRWNKVGTIEVPTAAPPAVSSTQGETAGSAEEMPGAHRGKRDREGRVRDKARRDRRDRAEDEMDIDHESTGPENAARSTVERTAPVGMSDR
jgi:hypothetical protein